MSRSFRTTRTLAVVVLIASACSGRSGDAASSPIIDSESGASGESVSATLVAPDGRERSYQLYVPSTLPSEPVPLLIAMHGGLGWGDQFRHDSGFDALAEANGFLVAYPDGTRIIEGRDSRVWNGGACCGAAVNARRNVDDVGFIDALIDEISGAYSVDPARVYATGHSNGAIMAYRLACELADQISAVAFQAGSLEIDDCTPSQPVSVMNLHGLDDTNISIDGGRGSGVSRHEFASPRQSVDAFAQLNGCAAMETSTDGSNPDVSTTRWTSCDDSVAVELILVEGANHAWMGRRGDRIQRRLIGEAYLDIDAAATIWSFLAEQTQR